MNSLNPPRVLIVDDMAVNRKILSSLLSSEGVVSDMAESGDQCLKLCNENDYDLILLDHRMPELDGVDTLVRLKELFREKGKSIPVVCHTTEDAIPNINLYKAAGFADVLIKPIQPQQLSQILINMLSGRPDLSKQPSKKASESDIYNARLKQLPAPLFEIKALDINAGLSYCETAADYLDALHVFASSINDKAEKIQRLSCEQDLSSFSLRVHALKSTARIIGACSLADMAAQLERAAKDKQRALVKEGTQKLVYDYLALSEALNTALPEPPVYDKKPGVLLVEGTKGFVNQAILRSLENAGFTVSCCGMELADIAPHCDETDIFIFYPFGSVTSIQLTMEYLTDICRTEHKSICLIGDKKHTLPAEKADQFSRVFAIYEKPVNTQKLTEDLKRVISHRFTPNQQRRILIIDDDPDFLTIISSWLSGSYEVEGTLSGEEALSLLKNSRPDLILLDYELPNMSGYEILEKLRRNADTSHIPVIFLTGKSDRESVMRILKRKPDGYLLKTMSRQDLCDTLDRFFEGALIRHESV